MSLWRVRSSPCDYTQRKIDLGSSIFFFKRKEKGGASNVYDSQNTDVHANESLMDTDGGRPLMHGFDIELTSLEQGLPSVFPVTSVYCNGMSSFDLTAINFIILTSIHTASNHPHSVLRWLTGHWLTGADERRCISSGASNTGRHSIGLDTHLFLHRSSVARQAESCPERHVCLRFRFPLA